MTALALGRLVARPALPIGRLVHRGLDPSTVASLTEARVDAYLDRHDQLWRWDAFKVRYVRTPAGAKRYGVPIGSPIPVGRKVKPKTGGNGGGGATPKPSTPNRMQLSPGEKATAARAFEGDNDHGASINQRGELEVTDKARAGRRLDAIAANPGTSDADRGRAEQLRRRIDKLPDEPSPRDDEAAPPVQPPEPAAPDAPEPAAPPPADEPSAPQPDAVGSGRPSGDITGDTLTEDYRNQVQLDDAEKEALKSYTGGGYYGINTMLRGGSIEDAENNDPVQVQREIDSMNAVMSRYTTTGTITAHRSIYSDGSGTGIPAGDVTGKVITSPGFVSTAVDEPAPGFKHGQDHMEITIPPGMHGIDVGGSGAGAFGDREREFILPHNTRFRVDSVEYREVDGEPQRLLRVTALPPLEDPAGLPG